MSTIKLELLVSGFLSLKVPPSKINEDFQENFAFDPAIFLEMPIYWTHVATSLTVQKPRKNLEKDGWFVCLYDGGYIKDLFFPSTASVKNGRIKAIELK